MQKTFIRLFLKKPVLYSKRFLNMQAFTSATKKAWLLLKSSSTQ